MGTQFVPFDLWPVARLIVPGIGERPPPPVDVPAGYVLVNGEVETGRYCREREGSWSGWCVPEDLWERYEAALAVVDEIEREIADA